MKPTPTVLALLACAMVAGCEPAPSNYGTYPYSNTEPAVDRSTDTYFREDIGETILFAEDEATLTPEARIVLEEQAGWLTQNAGYTALIEGHADEQGTREYNLALGARRAASVQEYLVARGVASSRLRTVSYGKERPLEVCSEEACYQRNRRAVTNLIPGATS